MKNTHHKKISLLLSISIIAMLILIGPAQAVNVNLSQPSDISAGMDVSFTVAVEIEAEDSYLPVQYTNILVKGPSGFEETCRLSSNGVVTGCSLDLEVSVANLANYGYGYGYGYDNTYGYGYDFGYGYGYGYGGSNGLIVYSVTWHTPVSLEGGEYSAQADVVVQGDGNSHTYSSSEKTFVVDNERQMCMTLFGKFRYTLGSSLGDPNYSETTDLNGDDKVGILDLAIFAGHMDDEVWCLDQINPIPEGELSDSCLEVFKLFRQSYATDVFESKIDLVNDNVIDILDLAIFAGKMDDSAWCSNVISTSDHDGSYTPDGSNTHTGGSVRSNRTVPSFEEEDNGDNQEEIGTSGETANGETENENNGLDSITGSAIGNFVQNNGFWSAVIAFLLVVMAVFGYRKFKK